jgi:hypothetical protein
MIFFKRKLGESLVIETPSGDIIIRVLAGDELGIEVPQGITVIPASSPKPGNWLPSRPKLHVA